MTLSSRRSASPAPSAPADVSSSRLVVRGIVRGLEAGRFAPGQRLVEADLCVRFGVGRSSVREALQRLASQGVVELHRNRGATIRELTLRQALDTLVVTEVLAGLAARCAAQRIKAPGAEAVLRNACAQLASAAAADDVSVFMKARDGFFAALMKLSQNEELQRLGRGVQVHLMRGQFHIAQLQRRRSDAYDAIGAAVLAGDAERAESIARAHVRDIRAALERDPEGRELDHGGI
ncbi:MAG: GntR family transcriptional regulator [Hyphomonadaceae bacterium]